jgi:hypothetical protein
MVQVSPLLSIRGHQVIHIVRTQQLSFPSEFMRFIQSYEVVIYLIISGVIFGCSKKMRALCTFPVIFKLSFEI